VIGKNCRLKGNGVCLVRGGGNGGKIGGTFCNLPALITFAYSEPLRYITVDVMRGTGGF